MEQKKIYSSIMLLSLFIVLISCKRFIYSEDTNNSNSTLTVAEEEKKSAEPVITAPVEIESIIEITAGSNVYDTLLKAGINSATIHKIVSAASPLTDFQVVRAGTPFKVIWTDENKLVPKKVTFSPSPSSSLMIKSQDNDEWEAYRHEYKITIKHVTFSEIVNTNLWDSALIAGMDPALISNLADIFAWQFDFNREVRQGDRWRLTVEERYVNGKSIGFGNIIVAEYENNGETHTAIRFPKDSPNASYYDTNGLSLKRMFLKAPLKFGRVTSRFTNARFHPILKVYRPHNGVDYGAPVGTPILAVGRGTVIDAGMRGDSGIMVKIRHNSIYTTAYLHMSRVAKGIVKGKRVEQGQVIGYVGSTGLSTAPHLHFSFYENGKYVDPLGRKFPAADPIGEEDLPEFRKLVSKVMPILPDWNIAVATGDDLKDASSM